MTVTSRRWPTWVPWIGRRLIVAAVVLVVVVGLLWLACTRPVDHLDGTVVTVDPPQLCIDIGGSEDPCFDQGGDAKDFRVGDCVRVEVLHPGGLSNAERVPCDRAGAEG